MGRALRTSLAGAGLTLVALAFDTAPLLVLGIAVALAGAAALARVRLAAWGVRVQRVLEHTQVIEDEPLEASILVMARWPGLPRCEVQDPLAAGPIALARGTRRVSVPVSVRFPRRGRRSIEPPRLELTDALGLARAVRAGEGADEILVLPRIHRVVHHAASGGAAAQAGAARALREQALAADVDGLRPYRLGTPASRIHWPALARGADLLERRIRPDGDPRPLVVLDARADGDGDPVDAAVRAAASLVLELARGPGRGCALLLPGERRPATVGSDLVTWPAVHVRLALVQGGEHCSPPELRAALARHGTVFYVSARPLRGLPRGTRELERAQVMLVAPAPEGVHPAFEVAGLYGFPAVAEVAAA